MLFGVIGIIYAAKDFLNKVYAAAVYHNASTAFTDGAQFGLGIDKPENNKKPPEDDLLSYSEIFKQLAN